MDREERLRVALAERLEHGAGRTIQRLGVAANHAHALVEQPLNGVAVHAARKLGKIGIVAEVVSSPRPNQDDGARAEGGARPINSASARRTSTIVGSYSRDESCVPLLWSVATATRLMADLQSRSAPMPVSPPTDWRTAACSSGQGR